ncbi:MAG: iron-containing alcohol dehydrogenase [Spirochaetales bacterium]|nr:iron-containing alcohol dehydrogenase [Spirochaetales bacterium]
MKRYYMSLRKFVSPEIIFGNGARNLAGKYGHQFSAEKALVVTDKNLLKTGWVDDVLRTLHEQNIKYTLFSDVTPNPRAFEVMHGADLYLSEGCNVIYAVGGGSPMDCAKGIGIVSSNQKNILNFEGIDKIINPVPPLIFIPTTAGSSADVSQFCIINDIMEKVKISIVSKAIVPDVALIDPETTLTMSPYLTACTGMDALVHAIEAFVSTGSGPLTDLYALNAIELLSENLIDLIHDPDNPSLREKIMLASMQAGLAFSNAILGTVHAMAHSLGGFLDLPHGECNALLLEHVIDYNFDSVPDRYSIIANRMGSSINNASSSEIKEKLLNRIRSIKSGVGISSSLIKRGVKPEDLKQLASKAEKDACMLTNPKPATAEDLENIFGKAL